MSRTGNLVGCLRARAVVRTQGSFFGTDPSPVRLPQSLPGDGPVLDMLLETTLIGEDLVAEVAALFLPGEQEPEEEAIDPAHKARQESAGGTGRRGA